nr:T9SS type A sorting domain-containing protein [Candidatus Neomarinimicrobiota bacterium]
YADGSSYTYWGDGGYIGVISSAYEIIVEDTLIVMEDWNSGDFHDMCLYCYDITAEQCIAVSYDDNGNDVLARYTLPGLEISWAIEGGDEFGEWLGAVNITAEQPDEVVSIHHDYFTVFNSENGDSVGSSTYYVSHEELDIIETVDGFALYGIEDEKVIKYVGGLLDIRNHANQMPSDFGVSVYPNPFNNRLSIEYRIVEPGIVCLEVFDIQGRLVAELQNRNHSAGVYNYQWDADYAASGVYFVTLNQGAIKQVKKVILLN